MPVWKKLLTEAEYSTDAHFKVEKELSCNTYQRIKIWRKGAHSTVRYILEIYQFVYHFYINVPIEIHSIFHFNGQFFIFHFSFQEFQTNRRA